MNLELIRKTVLFRDMNDGEFNKALEIFDAAAVEYKKGDLLHSEYTLMKSFGLVLSGVVQICVDDIDGNRMIMAEVTPGVTFGESLCFLEIKDSPVYIYATENSEVLWLSVKNLYADNNDEFLTVLQKRFTSMLAERTLKMNDRIQVLSKIKIRDKLMTYFSQLSQSSGSKTFQIPINRDDLATYVGTNRSALSRELSNMKNDGIIDYYKNTVKLLNKE